MPPHIFLAVPLIVSIIQLTHTAQTIPDASLLNLKPILDELTNSEISNNECRNEPIYLHGQYHILESLIRSQNISIIGGQSASIVSSGTENEQALSNSNPSSMLIVSNSTVALSSLRLICNGDHISVATISESSMSVSNCKIGAASSTSPFLSSCTPSDNLMLTVVDTQVNWKHALALPLFGTMPTNHKSLVTESSETSILGRDTDQARNLLSIVGSGLSFSNTAFPLATGPLFDFGFDTDNTQQSLLAASVCLTRSEMTNVTSRRRLISDTVRFPLVSQRVICSSISESTNHLCGTGSLDLNFGSALCCLNSSFSKCQTDPDPTEGPPTVYLQHRSTQFNHKLSPAFTTFDTCTFRDIHAERGSAIESNQATATLSVTKCSFLRCSADRLGGSIYCWPSPSCSIAVSLCSFASGNSDNSGGAIQYNYCHQGSITDCVFYNVSAANQGGGLTLADCIQATVTVSNTLFQKCRTSNEGGIGGAVSIKNCVYACTSLRFRGNSAVSLDRGHDVGITNTISLTSERISFTDCDTDQETIEIYFDSSVDVPPNMVSVSNLLTVSSISTLVSSDNRTAKATLTVDRPISGTVLMLVDNTDNYEMPNEDSPPPINRLISFDFSPDSTSTESELSFGEWEVLQYEANYSLITFGWKEWIVDTDDAVLTTPNPPRIVRAMCKGGNSEFDAFFSLKARTLATGSYKASVKGKSDFWMVVEFEHNPSGGNIFSTGFGLKLQGEDAILDFETTYEIDSVIDESRNKILILDPPRLFFTTPSHPTLKSVGKISFSDSNKDTITIKLVGENLFANPYTLTVSSGSTTSTLTAVFDADGVNGETTAVLYSMDGSKKVDLSFGKTYTISGFTSSASSQPKLTPNLKIAVPSEPPRVERVLSSTLNDAQDQINVVFKARALPSAVTAVTITRKDDSVCVSAQRLTSISFSALFNVAEATSSNSLAFGETYSIESVSNGTSFILNPGLAFLVPSKTQLIDIDTTFSNEVKTGLDLVLKVDGSIHNSKYKLTMNDDIEVEVECSSSTFTCRTVTPIRIGWETGIQYETEYTISTMEEIGGFSHRVDLVKKTFTTETKPTQPVFHVDESGGVGDFCGDDGDRCKTIDEVWRIVKGIGFARPTLLILDSTTLDSPIVVSEGMHAMVTNESSTEPKLRVASFDLGGGELGMIVVDSAFLELRNVDVHVLSVSPSFVLIHGTNSELVFRDGLFAGPANGMTMNEDADGVCSWSSGALQLINCTTEITNTRLFRLSQGAINMKNGSLEIRSSSFDSNSASSSSFPSSRRNIHCSDDGTITIGSLNGGDGFQGSSLWASMEDCVMDGDAAQPDSPLFVPQLDKEQSKSVLDTTTQQYQVIIVGSRLIPCGLFLEVFEHESESNADGKSVEFELNHTSSDTEVTLVIEQEEIAALDQKLELRCRLIFGQNVRTTDWFTFSAAHIDDPESPEPEPTKPKFSETPLGKALSWILPLVVSVVLLLIILLVIFLVLRRKRQPKQEDKTELVEQESDEVLAKVEDLDSRIDETRNIVAVNKLHPETTNIESKLDLPSTAHEEVVEVLCLSDVDQKDIAETKFVASKETLFHRLHEAQNPKPIKAEKIQKALTEQLLRVMQKMPTAQVLQNLNPHWVILGDESEVHFKLADEQTKNPSLGDKLNNPNGGDAQRWNPPEETEEKIESQQKSSICKEAGLVFRLGLLLWEIETGQVPYREHDGLNAHRQIVLGVGLKMNAVENEGLRELIEDCMQIEAKKRPTLQKVNDRLVKCFSPSASDPTLGQQNHKAESKQ
ncbi:hypothetical protein BLNAU_1992 [Blattamonas nauphoetae]|uniref:Protein kinase domain-containing protein n=1 Tax=Blattamonas nauphoetae TaxID=2049346 RepID=A0ABQ9YGU0_9EUKA|nr:hypothetical protein BLNAU_1992 [Blattamonas nauphoetae]